MEAYWLWAAEIVDTRTGGRLFNFFTTQKEADAYAEDKRRRTLTAYVWKM